MVDFDGVSFISNFSIFRRQNGSKLDQDFTLCTLVSVRDYGRPVRKSPSLLKLVWVGKIHGVGVYATHSVRIWWFRNKFSLFQ